MKLYRLETVTWQDSQLLYHALPRLEREGLILLFPGSSYVCIGYFQDAEQEVDLEYCRQESIPVFRREVGGGAVYLDGEQLWGHLGARADVAHQRRAPLSRQRDGRVVAPGHNDQWSSRPSLGPKLHDGAQRLNDGLSRRVPGNDLPRTAIRHGQRECARKRSTHDSVSTLESKRSRHHDAPEAARPAANNTEEAKSI